MLEDIPGKINILAGKIKQFKRRTMGFCGKESVKSLDELAKILCDLKVVYNGKDATELIQKLYYIAGGLPYNSFYNIIFSDYRGKNKIWGEACRVELSPLYPPPFTDPEKKNYFE